MNNDPMSNTTPYQRLREERRELAERINKLVKFIFNETTQVSKYESLDEENKHLLSMQLDTEMRLYSLLTQRIEAFKE